MSKSFKGISLIVLGILAFVMGWVDAGVVLGLMGIAVLRADEEEIQKYEK